MTEYLTDELVDEARTLIRQSNKKITASELATALQTKPFVATHLIKTTPLLEFHALPESMSASDMMSNMSNMEPQQSMTSANSVMSNVTNMCSNVLVNPLHSNFVADLQ